MEEQNIFNFLEKKVLALVQKPGRYIGGEVNSVYKDITKISVHTALIFPDVYEIGMSNLGLKILYEEINAIEDFYAERAFSPWNDMEGCMRKYDIPAFSLETHSPLKDFDVLGFSLQYELCFTNVINLLDLSRIPLYAKDRLDANYPFIVGGGCMAYNPEPIAPFMDAFIIGDGEKTFVSVLNFYKDFYKKMPKKDFLIKLSETFDFVYVPLLYDTLPDSKGRLSEINPSGQNVRKEIKKYVAEDLNECLQPKFPVVPLIETVHDRISVEIMRGCPRSCRFCQAGVLYKPVRKRDAEVIFNYAQTAVKNTGYNEIGLLSLSSTDYGGIEELTNKFLDRWKDRTISISMPSMRIDSFSLKLMDKISSVKKTGITLAPEAASEKLLSAINKGCKPTDVIEVAQKAFGLGYRVIKLYFMIGLPGETYEDLDELNNLLLKISKIGFMQVNVSISTLIPKPHTPFQWMDMIDLGEIESRQAYVRKGNKSKRIKLKFHSPLTSVMEAVFTRGDRRLTDVIKKAWEKGCRFDQWEECFRYDLWMEAFAECSINPMDYLLSWQDNHLPWEHIDCGVKKDFLKNEWEKTLIVLNCL